jgi:hypothetical protein
MATTSPTVTGTVNHFEGVILGSVGQRFRFLTGRQIGLE